MFKWILLSASLILSFSSYARTHDALMREAWTRDLKVLLSEIEQKHSQLLVENEKRFLERFALISSAWADSRFNCFYGGWPSVLRSSGGKKLCQLPFNTNPNYDKGSCAKSEIQCQPQLFNKGLCVPFSTPEERRSSFSNCEKKFQEKGGDYSFLDEASAEDLEELKEISLVAAEVCGPKSDSNQKNTAICKSIIKKFPDGMKSIRKGISRATASVETPVTTQEKIPLPKVETKKKEELPHSEKDCDMPGHPHTEVAQTVEAIQEVANKSLDEMYESMKEKFQSSPFCRPENVLSDPSGRPSGVLIKLAMNEVNGIEQRSESGIQLMLEKYQISSSARQEIASYISQIKSNPYDAKTLRARLKGVFIQDMLNNPQIDMAPHQNALKEELAKKNVFVKKSDGQIECPFVSKDAFIKAMTGREEVLKKYQGRVQLPGQITIVDYSRPSNERRMFVLDLNKLEVMHNTWVAHGIGDGKDGSGSDGKGGGPEMSNESGSLRSSDGFILAGKASHGARFGNNVLLSGIDSSNTNLASRAVILHGWEAPMEDYSLGIRTYNRETRTYSAPLDTVGNVKKIDFKTATTKEMEESLWDLSDATNISRFISPTEGCMGVPETSVKHLDRKGRSQSQLELLRQDLPGSIIFNYSGPEMSSKYF